MCQISIKVPAMFDQTPPPPHTFDKQCRNSSQQKSSESLTLIPIVKNIPEFKRHPLFGGGGEGGLVVDMNN